MQQSQPQLAAPWWKFGHVWLIVAGPAVVIVASFITLYLAVTRSDPVIGEDIESKNAEMIREASHSASLAPAMKARNHAQTGVVSASPPQAAQKP